MIRFSVPTPTRQKTHCKRGHEFTPENTIVVRSGTRTCRLCDRMRKAKHVKKMRATKEIKTAVACPGCGVIRPVVMTTAKRLEVMLRLCRSCSRKVVRGKMAFAPSECAKCGKMFSGRSGAARFCDTCASREPLPERTCPICNRGYVGYKSKTACSNSCLRRLRMNGRYFGGRMLEAEGWSGRECQVCLKHVKKNFHIHHVYGHPDHSKLVLLCAGCHNAVSKLASRKALDWHMLGRIAWFAMAQKLGCDPGDAPNPCIH